MSKHFALIPAAGSGSRMGSPLPKQYLPLAGRPLIWHALSALSAHAAIERVYVVLAPDDEWWATQAPGDFGGRLRVLRCGGATRAETVLNGLKALGEEAAADDWVLVHDAARPCLRARHLDALISALHEDPVGGLLAVPVADTLKRADDQGRVARTEPREGLWRAQTPQMFRLGLLRRALEASGGTPTDEAQAVERLGESPRLIMGDDTNFKVTYPEDMKLAERILGEQRCA